MERASTKRAPPPFKGKMNGNWPISGKRSPVRRAPTEAAVHFKSNRSTVRGIYATFSPASNEAFFVCRFFRWRPDPSCAAGQLHACRAMITAVCSGRPRAEFNGLRDKGTEQLMALRHAPLLRNLALHLGYNDIGEPGAAALAAVKDAALLHTLTLGSAWPDGSTLRGGFFS